MTHPRLRAERSPQGFRRLLLARPERHNPLDAALARALRDAFAEDPWEPVLPSTTGSQGSSAKPSGPRYPACCTSAWRS